MDSAPAIGLRSICLNNRFNLIWSSLRTNSHYPSNPTYGTTSLFLFRRVFALILRILPVFSLLYQQSSLTNTSRARLTVTVLTGRMPAELDRESIMVSQNKIALISVHTIHLVRRLMRMLKITSQTVPSGTSVGCNLDKSV